MSTTSLRSSGSSRESWVVAEQPAAEEGDTVIIDFVGSRDGEAFRGRLSRGHLSGIGFWPHDTRLRGRVGGRTAGKDKVLELTFPEDYQSEALAGADVQFAVTLKEVKTMELAPVDEALFAKYGLEEGDEQDFRVEVKQNMERELRNAIEASVKNQVMDGIVAAHDSIELPATLISREVTRCDNRCFSSLGARAPAGHGPNASVLPDEMFCRAGGETPSEAGPRRCRDDRPVSSLTAEPAKVRDPALRTSLRPIKTRRK